MYITTLLFAFDRSPYIIRYHPDKEEGMMGKKVSAAQAARLAARNERIIRGWIKSGKLRAEKPEGTRDWQIDIDDLARVPGVKLVSDDARDSSLSARIEALEARVAQLESLVARLSESSSR